MNTESILKQVHAAVAHAAHLAPSSGSIDVAFDGSLVTLSGEVPSVAVKKMALEAATRPGVRGVVDLLRVRHAGAAGDGAVRDGVTERLLDCVDFRNCTIRAMVKGHVESLREQGADGSGCIVVAVGDGVVTLSGNVISLTHMRLAGVLAWWTSGCCDLVNALVVSPPEEDSDDELADALRLVLETDRRVHAEQVGIRAAQGAITLEGNVASAEERWAAEQDAWCVQGVDRVVNHLEVRT